MRNSLIYTKPIVVYCLVALIVFLILILPIRNTLSLMLKYISLQETLKEVGIGSTPTSYTNEQLLLVKADTITQVFEVVSIAAQSYNVIIKQYEPPHMENDGDVQIQTLDIVLQGEFVDILKCLQFTDTRLNGIKIASIKFNRQENNKRVFLVASIVFKRIQVISSNE
jgi:hypothetical protein